MQNLRKRVIGMLNAGMTINAVAVNIRCSTRAIRHLRQRFQATGRTVISKDLYYRHVKTRACLRKG